MLKQAILLCYLFSTTTLVTCQSTMNQTVKDLGSDKERVISGNLNEGKTMPLEWATNSAVACFPSTRFIEYRGAHVLYKTTLPANSEINITVTPKSKKDRINLYAIRLGADSQVTPPEIQSAISCEASYPIYAGTPNLKKSSTPKSVSLMSIRHPYTIVIGVAGAADVLEGEYELKYEITSR